MTLSGSIFISGGGGTLGKAIIRRAKREAWDCKITVFSRDSHKHAMLLREFPDVRCIQGDIAGDLDYLTAAIAGHQIVIHAAASKHVDLAERNAFDTVRTNIDGSRNVAIAAARAKVEKVVGVSTDKECHSVNIYGASKLAMSRMFQEANNWGDTDFHLVRYGNVCASNGSVINVWREMFERNGYVTATDPDMTRFWMSVEDAVDVVLKSLTEPAGTITIPRCKSLDMQTFAQYVMPGVEFRYSGLRPGEKRYEELLTQEEVQFTENSGDYMRLWPVTGKPLHRLIDPYRSDKATRLFKDELLGMLAK